MLSPKLASRYAKSLFVLAKEMGNMDAIVADMRLINETVSASKDLALMLKSPLITPDKKEKIIGLVFENNLSEVTTTFVHLLVRKGREKHLAEVASSFIDSFNKLNHVATASLTTAVEVDVATIQKIKTLLLSIDGNTSVELETKVDPKIVGGFVLKYGDKLLDQSIQRKLHIIKKEIQDSSYINKI
jgi:F-type H+-transporting ATPase subunit delta